MPSFPLLAFAGLSPFIAIAANNRAEKSLWTSLELVLLGLSFAFFASTVFTLDQLSHSIAQAILFTLPFLGYTFVRKTLGHKVSIITIPIFWLALEYVFLKWYPFPSIFLADILAAKSGWTLWNAETGYLGSSLWILICNTLLFQAILTEKKVNWFLIALFVMSVIGPILYAYSVHSIPITRDEMLQLYSGGHASNTNYATKGEFIPRTAAWISVLILLFAAVKNKTSRR